jgi:hypothetical protein
MKGSRLELADIFRLYGPAYREQHRLTKEQVGAMFAIENCRTAVLGGHVDKCDHCGHTRISYNSCRNRHCPKCQSLAKAEWLQERLSELLPVEYFHVVFTLPACFNSLALQNKEVVYNLLFHSASQTLLEIAADPKHLGAEIGFLSILHTWGQNLQLHPHLHFIIPGGGLSRDGSRWISCRKGFFLPVKVLSRLFRKLFVKNLSQAYEKRSLNFYGSIEELSCRDAFYKLLSEAGKNKWVVYCKRPVSGPQQVLNYLGQYTHRVAISNSRLLSLEQGQVRFSWRDYRDSNRIKEMSLDASEFIRRFLLHILPTGFQRIRYYGWMSNRKRTDKLAVCRKLLGLLSDQTSQKPQEQSKDNKLEIEVPKEKAIDKCPVCKQGRMIVIEILNPLLLSSSTIGIDSS